jgi:hypothetical protein
MGRGLVSGSWGGFVTAKRPNIVVILSDDAGFEEFGIYKGEGGPAGFMERSALAGSIHEERV